MLCKKIFVVLGLITALPAFATGISPNDTGDNMCVYNVLNTYTGPANLTAGWQANTIQLKWYNGDQQLNVQSAANNCTYDSGLTIPSTAPTKTGYTFAGWKIKAASVLPSVYPCGLHIMTAVGGNLNSVSAAFWGHDINENVDYCVMGSESQPGGQVPCANTGVNMYEWELGLSYGVYRGSASCSNNSGEQNVSSEADMEVALAALDPLYEPFIERYENPDEAYENGTMTAEDSILYESLLDMEGPIMAMSQPRLPATALDVGGATGTYCWCRIDSFTPNSGSQCSLPSAHSWVKAPASAAESVSQCSQMCPQMCGVMIAMSNNSSRAFLNAMLVPLN